MGEIGTVSAILNVIGSIGALWVMQLLTTEAGVSTPPARVKLAQRAALALAAIIMMYSAAYSISTDSAPRPVDLVVEFTLLLTLFVTVARIAVAHAQAGRRTEPITTTRSRALR